MSRMGPKEFTREKLSRMDMRESSEASPTKASLDRKADQDNFGMTAAKSSNIAHFRHGGSAHKPHAGHRLRRASGGKVAHSDEPEDRALVKKMVKGEALTGKSEGGRAHRASGGRAKGKTTVNIIIGGPKAGAPTPPMAMGSPPIPPGDGAPPPPPPAPPGAGMRPPVGGPMPMPMPVPVPVARPGMPPGGMPMRARGGKVVEKYGSGSGMGRMENTRREKD